LIVVEDVEQTPRIKSYYYINNTISGIQEPPANEPVITSLNLNQNFPNPFNSMTIIKYQVSKSVLINLIVYDLTGKEVIRLIENRKVYPGEHQVTWNGNDQTGKEVSSGIYIYVLTAGKYKQARKMVVLK
ncbi:MAG: T9SS type A sorting domain-containing protein, partial [Ignavibacteriaceae bacterium]